MQPLQSCSRSVVEWITVAETTPVAAAAIKRGLSTRRQAKYVRGTAHTVLFAVLFVYNNNRYSKGSTSIHTINIKIT